MARDSTMHHLCRYNTYPGNWNTVLLIVDIIEDAIKSQHMFAKLIRLNCENHLQNRLDNTRKNKMFIIFLLKASEDEAYLPKCNFLLCFCLENTANTILSADRHVQNATSLYSHSQDHCFLPIFAILAIFTFLESLYKRHTYLIGIFCFVFIHRIQPDTF